jgi:two-component system response regulator FixJ
VASNDPASSDLVHVVDDDDDARDSVAFLLGTADIAVMAYPSAEAFLEALPGIAGGCVLTDVRMPGIDGMELLRRLKENGAALPVIVMTGHGDVPLAVEAMKLGAVDFLEKPFDDSALIASVQAALSRDRANNEQAGRQAEILERMESLSPRERQVLDGLVAGHPNKTIAFDLGISARTVEVYRANVMTKMKAGSLSELVRMALLAGT